MINIEYNPWIHMKLKEVLLEDMTSQFIELCKQELGIDEEPPIELVNEPTVGGGTSFGEFTDAGIRVATANRHPMDVYRTLAHELTHWKQRTNNQEMDGADGSDTENEANAKAGVILRKFGKEHPECFVI